MKNLIFRSQHLKLLNGQSLFEVLVAIAVAALIMTGVVSLTTVALKNSTESKNNTLATKYAQQGIEWLREQRDQSGGWDDLLSRSSGGGSNHGIGGNPPGWNNNVIDGIFSRTVLLRSINNPAPAQPTIEATVEVSWDAGGRTNVVRSITRFTNWNR